MQVSVTDTFESAAALFGLLAAPIRLKIIDAVYQGEQSVSDLLRRIHTTQPNMSQHLATLYRAGVLVRRRQGTQVFYRLQNGRIGELCKTVRSELSAPAD